MTGFTICAHCNNEAVVHTTDTWGERLALCAPHADYLAAGKRNTR